MQTNQENEANINQDTNININNLIDDTSELNRRAQIQNLINKNSDSTLMAWFKLNETQEAARQHLYRDIPKYYTFDKGTRSWKPRKAPNLRIVGRLYTVHAKDSERFSLRLLLNHQRGATSFNDLKTINGFQHQTFKSAAIAKGLIEDSQEAINCLSEAYLLTNNNQKFREFFCQYLLNCSPEPGLLWQHFKNNLSEDILLKLRRSQNNDQLDFTEEIHLLGLIEIKKILNSEGSDLKNFPDLPQLTDEQIENLISIYQNILIPHISHEISVQESVKIFQENFPRLNIEQRSAFDAITNTNQNEG